MLRAAYVSFISTVHPLEFAFALQSGVLLGSFIEDQERTSSEAQYKGEGIEREGV